jgi:hypothetical protein
VIIKTKITWEAIGRPVMVSSLGGIKLFKGKMINLCGKLTRIFMNANGTSTKEDFEIVKFIENNAPFTMLLGNPWIERNQAKRKEEEKVLVQNKKELKDFMTRRITHLIEEQENKSKLSNTREPYVKVAITLEDPHNIEVPIPDKEEVSPLNLRKESQQRKVTMPKEHKNQNGKRHIETNLTGKKDRRLSKKRDKIDKLQKVPEGTLQKENFQNWSFTGIIEQCHKEILHGEEI